MVWWSPRLVTGVVACMCCACALDPSGLGGPADGGAERPDTGGSAADGGGSDAGEPGGDAGEADAAPVGVDAGAELFDAGVDAGPVPGALPTLRWELPCTGSHGTTTCPTDRDAEDVVSFTGAPGVTYDVTLHFRGVSEHKSYSGGMEDGLFSTGGTPRSDGYTVVGLEVDRPAQTFYLNNGTSGELYCIPVDYQRTIRIRTGATVRTWARTSNTVSNWNKDSGGTPIVVPGVPPAPAAFDGQFLQIDMVSAAPR